MNTIIWLRRIISVGILAGFLIIMTGAAEWLIWVNADRYPPWLATDMIVDGAGSSADLITGMPAFEQQCGQKGGFAVEMKVNGTFLRCENGFSVTGWLAGVYHLTFRGS
jgi:hypothetical protein